MAYDDDYELDRYQRQQNIYGSAASGGLTGASLGLQVGGPYGALIGGLGGAAGGAIYGSWQNEEQRLALQQAKLRDEEIERRIGGVDYLGDFLSSANVLQTGKEEAAQIGTRQAAARAGLSGAAQEDLSARARSDIAKEKAVATAAAVPAAARADISEKDRIVREEMGRQDLFDRATQGPDWMGELGALGGAAAAVAGQATAAGGALEGGAAVAAKDITPEEYAGLNPDEQMAALNALDVDREKGLRTYGFERPPDRSALGDLDASPDDLRAMEFATTDYEAREAARETPTEERDFAEEEFGAQMVEVPEMAAFKESVFGPAKRVDQLDQQAELLSTEEDLIAERRAVLSDLQDVRSVGNNLMARDVPPDSSNVQDLIANDLQTGAVSQNEFEAIIAANPNALTDYNIWMTEVIKYREGDANLGAVDPGYSIESGTVSSSTIDALIR